RGRTEEQGREAGADDAATQRQAGGRRGGHASSLATGAVSLGHDEGPRSSTWGLAGGRYWDRTSDLFRVREARYRCANRPRLNPRVVPWRWRRDSNPCGRLCRPLPRLSATPPFESGAGMNRCHVSERMTGFEPATLTLAR